MRKFLRILPYMIMVVAAVIILSCCRLVVTAGASMEPTYSTGDRLFCIRSFAPPSAGDVILFKKDGKLLVKRVAAEPGEVADLPNDELPAYDYWGSDTVPESNATSIQIPLSMALFSPTTPNLHWTVP